jgi:hypothetical protein
MVLVTYVTRHTMNNILHEFWLKILMGTLSKITLVPKNKRNVGSDYYTRKNDTSVFTYNNFAIHVYINVLNMLIVYYTVHTLFLYFFFSSFFHKNVCPRGRRIVFMNKYISFLKLNKRHVSTTFAAIPHVEFIVRNETLIQVIKILLIIQNIVNKTKIQTWIPNGIMNH